MLFRFGLYQFDVETFDLRREGLPVRIQAQPAQVLALLVRRAGEIVRREELHTEIWGGETFVDFDRGLNFCISQVRASLRDNAAEPTYIRTISRQGYQFIAPVERVEESAKVLPQAAVQPPEKSVRWFAAFAVLLLATLGAGWWIMAARKLPAVVAVVRFDNETGNPALTRFADNLTDDVVVRLTAQNAGRVDVIGNASLLRLPREQRNLGAIAASLKASYVVLGQIQEANGGTRILAHLIRLPDQKHLWVVRIERGAGDMANLGDEAAQRIANEFSHYLATGKKPVSSPALADH